MAQTTVGRHEGAGFSFDHVQRNALLLRRGVAAPKELTTGTTLAGVVFKEGVVMGSDTRATAGDVIADKNCVKLHPLTPNIYCAGSGTSADCEQVSQMAASALHLHSLDTGRQPRVITAETLLKSHLRRYQGYVSAGLIVGGVDLTGPHITSIFPHGSTDTVPYATMGSGSLNAMSILEAGYRDDMGKDEAIALLTRAIRGGIYNDLASGSNVDLVVVTKDGAEMIRGHQHLMDKTYARSHPPQYPPGTAKVVKEQTISISELVVDDGDAMDTSW